MAERRKRAKHASVADQNVEPLIALVERGVKPRDALVVLEVKRNKRGGAAGRADRVVELLQAADRARECDHVRARTRERERRRIADAARGAGDERNLAGEGRGHRPLLMGHYSYVEPRAVSALCLE